MAQQIPPSLEQDLRQYEARRREHETIQVMTQTMQNELTEVQATLEEMTKQSDDVVTYKTVGQVMFRVEAPKLIEELQDREKTLEMRLASFKKKAATSSEKLKELESKIQLELSKHNLRLQ